MFLLNNIEHRYGAALTNKPTISIPELKISSQGVTAIIGPSGSGKTTLLSILSGFLTPQQGETQFDGTPLEKTGHKPGDVAFVFQSPMLLGASSGLVNLLQGHVASDRDGKSAIGDIGLKDLFAKLGLDKKSDDLVTKRSKKLSGGEAQRFAVARALLTDPKAILCDEPTSSLDERNSAQVMEALVGWADTSEKPIVWVTHNMHQAARFADHYIFLSDGELVDPTPYQQEALASGDYERRLEALLSIAGERIEADTEAVGDVSRGDKMDVSQSEYSAWIANSLSTDRDRISKNGQVKREGLAYAPAKLRNFYAIFSDFKDPKLGFFAKLFGSVQIYSRHLLTFVVALLSLQVFLAFFLGILVERYAAINLEDPSIARISFEYDDTYIVSGQPKPVSLDDNVLTDIVSDVRERLQAKGDATENQLNRVRAYGRWDQYTSELRFMDGAEKCQAGFNKVLPIFLNINDPLINQTKLRGIEDTKSQRDALRRVVEKARMARDDLDDDAMYGIIMKSNAERIEKVCDLEFGAGTPVRAEFALESGYKQGVTRTLHLIEVAEKAPPLHPFVPDLILFEHDRFEIAQSDARNKDGRNFQRANLYFPIKGFANAKKVLAERSYFQTDDSEAAVDKLREIRRYASLVPWVLIVASLVLLFFTIFMTVSSLLELNRRVIAVFRAHGMTFSKFANTIIRHVLPGFMYGTVLMVIIGTVLTFNVAGVASGEIPKEMTWGIFGRSLLLTVGTSLVVFVFSVLFIVWSDWVQTKAKLFEYLKE